MMMEGEAPGAVMPKRQRSESPSRTSASAHASPSTHGRRLEELTGSVSALAQAVCSVNGSAMNAVKDKWIESSAAEQGWRSRLMQCEEKLVEAYAHRTQSELGGLALSQQLSQQHEMIHHLQEAVKSTAANVTQHVQSYISSDVATVMEAMQTQLDREVELNNALSSRVQELATSTVQVMHQHAANARQDALSSTEKDVYIARLRASLAFEQQHAARRIREVEALMRLVQHLAEKSRADLASREELQRARAHVRLLEGQLHLHDIAAAVLPADFSSSVAGVEAPSEELRRVAPHYFALRMLQHKDITLCELMDSWFEQEGRLMRAERATAEMKMHVEEMQRDATLVHQRYLEERQRREISDRRITEMVRERLRTGQGDAAVEELQQLRWSYSQVVDDAAQLAVSLKMAREELEASMKEVAEQQRKICTMVQDAKTDQVAMTLTELRTYYESTVKSLEVAFADVEMQRQLILRTNEELTASSEKTHAACVSAQANEAVALQRLHPTTTPPPSTTRNNSLTAAVEKVGRCVDVLENRTMHLQSVMEKLLHGATQRAETVRSHFQEDVRRLVALIGEVHARSVQDKEVAAHSTDNISQQVHEVQQSEYANMMRQVLMEAGRFVVEHLELTDVQRTSLLDTSLSDAQYVLLLVQRARDLSQERDALRRELAACHELIEANHLTVLERALMHEVSVEDAMSAAEAAEHIMALRAQVAALLHGRQQALNDVAELDLMQRQMERAANSAESTNIAMQEHVQRLKDALHSSLSREAALCEKMVEVQNHMDALVQQQTEARASGSSDEAEATAELRSLVGRLDVELHQMRDVVAAANKHSHDASAAPSSSSSSAIPSEAELAAQLARGGFHAIVSTLRGALMKVGLLKTAVERNTWEAAEAIGNLANTNVTCGPEVELIRTQKQLREVEEQLHAAEAENEKMMATNQRVLGIVKSLMGKNKALTEEAATWRAKVGELEQRAEQALCDKEVRLPGEPQVEVPLHPPQEEPHAQAQATMLEEAEEQSDTNMMPQPPSSS